MDSYSSADAALAADNILDGNPDTAWKTLGSVAQYEEFVILDLGAAKPVSALALTVSKMPKLFPRRFSVSVSLDKVDWTPVVAKQAKFRPISRKKFVWEFDPADARYVRLQGYGEQWGSDKRYYWQIGNIDVPMGFYASAVTVSWTAPADDGYVGDPVSGYDIRWSRTPITEGTFGSATRAFGTVTPVAAGSRQEAVVNLGDASGTVYLAVKSVDAVGNWSLISNVVPVTVGAARIWSETPEDDCLITADAPRRFVFGCGAGITPWRLTVSSSPAFPRQAALRPDGEVTTTTWFGLKKGMTSWMPAKGTWRRLKDTVCSDGALNWRVMARTVISKRVITIYGPCETRISTWAPSRTAT